MLAVMSPGRLIHLFVIVSMVTMEAAHAEQDYGTRVGVRRGQSVSFEPHGPGVLFGPLDPVVQRWYVPQELYDEFQWRQWEHTNYAQVPYQRYVNTNIEGDYFYDFLGDYVTRGWLVYDWRQDQPKALGSAVFKGEQFHSWFNSVSISRDGRGQNMYAITVGNQIRAGLTPMTFSKPTFNGAQFDFMSDKYAATVLASRISDPGRGVFREPRLTTNSTSLIGGRVTAQVGDFITVGATLVDARNSNAAMDMFAGNFISGNLAQGQSQAPVEVIAVVLGDDSPDDGSGGAALFDHDIRITARDFDSGDETVFTLKQVVREGATWPAIFGGVPKSGFLAADGEELIVLNYDFRDPAYIGPDETEIVKVEFDYVLANDYTVRVWSNLQTGRRDLPTPPLTGEVIRAEEPALLTVKTARGNVKDKSNIRRLSFEYGLPTASLVGGFTIRGTDVRGFEFYGEWDRNVRYAQFPNAGVFSAREGHEASSQSADAWHMSLSKVAYPFFLHSEAYSFADDYSTTAFVVDDEGNVAYDDPTIHTYEFVDDNDDQDRLPDWIRSGSQAGDRVIFPGWDANNDFISDFNQNDNSTVANELPDYEEPFLRHDVDRPEFLFGIDLNNNGWIDRFEDDDLPDYPYRKDRRGYNAYAGTHMGPDLRLTVGRSDERMFSDDRDNTTSYGLLTLDRSFAGVGRLRLFDMLKLARDNIPDIRRGPTPFLRAPEQPLIEDVLPAQDTWINSLWLGFDYTGIPDVRIENKLKHEFYAQREKNALDATGRPLQGTSWLFGLVDKVEYRRQLGKLDLAGKFKSELLNQESLLKGEDDRKHWMGIVTLLGKLPVLSHSVVTTGLEFAQLYDRVIDEDEMLASELAGETGDFRSANLEIQLMNKSNYQGYVLTTLAGFRIGRISEEIVGSRSDGQFERTTRGTTQRRSFIVMYAGVE